MRVVTPGVKFQQHLNEAREEAADGGNVDLLPLERAPWGQRHVVKARASASMKKVFVAKNDVPEEVTLAELFTVKKLLNTW